jgi:hypothetical protein
MMILPLKIRCYLKIKNLGKAVIFVFNNRLVEHGGVQ